MINRQMEHATIKQWIKIGVDRYQQDLFGWSEAFIDEIDIAINFLSISVQNNDIRFKECTHTGLTKYKGLNNKEKYLITVDETEYIVTSVNNQPRMTQLFLKEVIIDE